MLRTEKEVASYLAFYLENCCGISVNNIPGITKRNFPLTCEVIFNDLPVDVLHFHPNVIRELLESFCYRHMNHY